MLPVPTRLAVDTIRAWKAETELLSLGFSVTTRMDSGSSRIFAVILIATYAGGFNMVCSFNLMDSFTSYAFYEAAGYIYLFGMKFSVVGLWRAASR